MFKFSEEWRFIPSLDGYMQVSNFGNVRSVDREVLRIDTKTLVKQKGRNIKLSIDKYGYQRIYTSVNGVKSYIRVHRAVALTFIPNPCNYPQVNHIDGNKQNNHIFNLEWCTNSENMIHSINTGLRLYESGEKSIRFERSVEVYKDGILVTTLSGNKEMELFGVDYRLVSACLLGKRKTHRGFNFKSF